jgi:hypothetical protein
MKTLLAIVNTPRESKGFLHYVAGLAINLSAQVKVLFIHTPANYSIGMADTTGQLSLQIKKGLDNMMNESQKVLEENIKSIEKELSNQIFANVSCEIGFADDRVDKFTSKNQVDMVILESINSDGFWSQTSSNMDVVKKVKCPVWIIPKGAVYKPFMEIVYATNYNKEDISSIKKLINTFPHYSPNITALHITDNVDFEERVKKAGFVEMLQKQTNYKPLWVRAIYQSKKDELSNLLNEFAIKSKADLLVLLKENKSFFENIFSSSHTKDIIKKTELPVLIYHEKK